MDGFRWTGHPSHTENTPGTTYLAAEAVWAALGLKLGFGGAVLLTLSDNVGHLQLGFALVLRYSCAIPNPYICLFAITSFFCWERAASWQEPARVGVGGIGGWGHGQAGCSDKPEVNTSFFPPDVALAPQCSREEFKANMAGNIVPLPWPWHQLNRAALQNDSKPTYPTKRGEAPPCLPYETPHLFWGYCWCQHLEFGLCWAEKEFFYACLRQQCQCRGLERALGCFCSWPGLSSQLGSALNLVLKMNQINKAPKSASFGTAAYFFRK